MEELLRKLNNHGIMANDGEHGKEIVKFFESIGAKINCTGNLYHHYHTLKDGYLECVLFEKPQHIITLEEAKKLKIMDNTKFTKADWKISRCQISEQITINSGLFNIANVFCYDVLCGTNDIEEAYYNALLISKAPEMLEMLIRLNNINDIAKSHISYSILEDLEKLIKEATQI
jgi:hypothetical protein